MRIPMQSSATKPPTTGGGPRTAVRESRRRIRHRIHTPAYASLETVNKGSMLDLCAILDLSEDGMSVQSPTALETNREVSFLLDFSETRSRVRATGTVIWSDRSGRCGIRFTDALPPAAVQAVQEWLFVNMLTALAHHAAGLKSEPISEPAEKPARAVGTVPFSGSTDYTGMLAALEAVKREVEALDGDLDRSLRLIVERALAFTRASGAAIAILEVNHPQNAPSQDNVMVCRSRAGSDAPSLGARLQAGAGFSGECVRTGKLMRCEDTEIDSRVDQDSCRALGIRSMVAVPVRSGQFVAGILEVFSPDPNAFTVLDNSALMRLAETVSFAIHRAAKVMVRATTAPAARAVVDRAPKLRPRETDPDVPALFDAEDGTPDLSWSRRVLLFAVALTLIIVVIWLVKTWPHNGSLPSASHRLKNASMSVPGASTTSGLPDGIDGVRALAEKGDAAAQFALGVHYATGEGVSQNYGEAVRWFSMAAEQGQVMAQATLGAYYWAGRGVPQDMQKAYFWAMLAQAGGDDASKVRVSFLASRMTRAQILSAQQRANEWVKEHQIVNNRADASR